MGVYLGIDQSLTCTGVCVLDQDLNILKAATISSPNSMDEFDRASYIAAVILTYIQSFNPTHVILEGLAFGSSGDATRKLAGLQFVIVTQIRSYCDIPISIVAPTTLKKFATGSGKSKKPVMLEHVPSEAKQILTSHFKKTKGLYDVVDAYFLASYGKSKLNTPISQ